MRTSSSSPASLLFVVSLLGCGRPLFEADAASGSETSESADEIGVDSESSSSADTSTTDAETDTSTSDTSTSDTSTSDTSTSDTSTSDTSTDTGTSDTSTDTSSTDTGTDTTDTGGLPCNGPCGSPDCGACPDIAQVDAQGYRIDATETRVSDYLEFAAIEFDPAFLAPACAWKVDFGWFVPEAWDAQQMADPDLPVTGVDWCDAEAFCRWTGRRLCGQIGGGAEDFAAPADPSGEWFAACSDGNTQSYPYGNAYQALACNGDELGVGGIVPVASLPACEGGLSELFDMSGNVWEWTDACLPDPGLDDFEQECRRRGGSWFSTSTVLRCAVDSTRIRSYRSNNTGIRCCAD